MVSPSDAFAMAWLIERHGLVSAPQVALSAPSLATLKEAAAAGATLPIMIAALSVAMEIADILSACFMSMSPADFNCCGPKPWPGLRHGQDVIPNGIVA